MKKKKMTDTEREGERERKSRGGVVVGRERGRTLTLVVLLDYRASGSRVSESRVSLV